MYVEANDLKASPVNCSFFLIFKQNQSTFVLRLVKKIDINYYQAYGLNIRSDFTLPELLLGGRGADLVIRQDKVDLPSMENSHIQRQGIEAWFGGNAEEAYLEWPGVAKFKAQGGSELIVEPTSRAIDRQILSLYVLSEALGMILHQRGLLLIHASAILIGNRTIIFAGMPGAGKSTTAAAFAQAGHPVLADDMVAIDNNPQGDVVVLPAFPQVKIWPTSMRGLGFDPSKLQRLFPGSRKRVMRQVNNFPTQSFPLCHIFFLEEGNDFVLNRMSDTASLLNITRFFSCPRDLLQGKLLAHHFKQCTHLLKQVGIWNLQRPDGFDRLQDFVENIHSFLDDCDRSFHDASYAKG